MAQRPDPDIKFTQPDICQAFEKLLERAQRPSPRCCRWQLPQRHCAGRRRPQLGLGRGVGRRALPAVARLLTQ